MFLIRGAKYPLNLKKLYSSLPRAGSGKSTLLKILAGRAAPGEDSGLSGMVIYNEKTVSEVQNSRLIAYVCGQLNK
jgi:ABC-type multidrug transport system ATPase subunit